jgi:hypothetical protein
MRKYRSLIISLTVVSLFAGLILSLIIYDPPSPNQPISKELPREKFLR